MSSSDCLFCKIVAGDIPADIIYETESSIAFRDVNPQAPTHVLIIPRQHIATINDLNAGDESTVGDLYLAAGKIAAEEGFADDGYGSIFVQRASRRYGCFNPEVTRAKSLTLNWLNDQQNFLSWSMKISEQFADMMNNTELEIDGYLAFATEELADTDKLYIFHLREKSNLCLTTDMQLSESRVLDFSNTGFALCIDTSALKIEQEEGKRSEEKYFTFSFGRGDKAIQKLFCDFTGFIDTLDTEQETQEFLQIVDCKLQPFVHA